MTETLFIAFVKRLLAPQAFTAATLGFLAGMLGMAPIEPHCRRAVPEYYSLESGVPNGRVATRVLCLYAGTWSLT